jgi:prepilin-type N-terminal cleavage/methylation domain-containing protein
MAKMVKTALSRRASKATDEAGFTLLEMVMTLTIVSIAFLSLTFVLFGAMKALNASRQRSFFNEQANKEVEVLRALSYDLAAGVTTTDINYTSAYPSAQFEGRDAVIVTSTLAPAAVSTVTVGAPQGIKLPYTIRRWVTWTDPTGDTYAAGSSPHTYKRLTVQMEWKEDSGAARKLRLISVFYPGGLGPPAGSGGSSTNHPPTAAFTVTPNPVVAGNSVTFDGSGSNDPDGDPLTYFWQFGDGQQVTGSVTAFHTYATGPYTAHLTVTDTGGLSSAPATNDVVVNGCGTAPPTASFTVLPPEKKGTAPFTVNVDGGPSSDPPDESLPCEVLTYDWNWGDGTAHGTGITAAHSYTLPNNSPGWTLILTVTDVDGMTGTTSQVIEVDPLNCQVTAGSFKNPSTNSLSNDIKVKSNGKPETNTSFTFYATTNAACTTVTGRIFKSGGVAFIVTLSITSDNGTTRQWSGTDSVDGNDSFPTGNSQTGEIWSPSSGAGQKFSFTYSVHT